ncbi:MAG TPA: tetratricopeptide repeat protein [Myxococcaceae bacterium]
MGLQHPELASALNNFAIALWYLERHEEARQSHLRALALSEKALGPEHPFVAILLTGLARDLVDLRRYDEAQQQLNRARSIVESKLGKDYPDLAYVLLVQGKLLLARKKPAEAVAPLERALQLSPKGEPLGEVRLSLAHALWEAKPAERPRAVGLATEARDTWQRLGHTARVAKASEWLAGHTAP